MVAETGSLSHAARGPLIPQNPVLGWIHICFIIYLQTGILLSDLGEQCLGAGGTQAAGVSTWPRVRVASMMPLSVQGEPGQQELERPRAGIGPPPTAAVTRGPRWEALHKQGCALL